VWPVKPLLTIEQDERLPGLGLLEQRLALADLSVRRVRAWEDDLTGLRATDYAGIAALGGNAQAWAEDDHPFLRDERRLLAEAVAEGVPVLGICLGAQVLARALGAEVRTAEAHEAGWLSIAPTPAAAADPLLGHLDGPTGVFQWHSDTFDLPDGAVHLASSELVENQAFRLERAWGLQSHPEVDYPTFASWIQNHRGAAEHYGLEEETLHAEVRAGDRETRDWRSRMFDAFLALVAVG
jgi:GMP synthase (glutamine-hydrolysing)